jgi:hypothetical protein
MLLRMNWPSCYFSTFFLRFSIRGPLAGLDSPGLRDLEMLMTDVTRREVFAGLEFQSLSVLEEVVCTLSRVIFTAIHAR